jgi:hypothetical protein
VYFQKGKDAVSSLPQRPQTRLNLCFSLSYSRLTHFASLRSPASFVSWNPLESKIERLGVPGNPAFSKTAIFNNGAFRHE